MAYSVLAISAGDHVWDAKPKQPGRDVALPDNIDTASPIAIAISGVSRFFGDMRALDNVSLSINTGEIVCLIGQSGCGKSSLLRIISGVDFEHSGTVTLFGKLVANDVAFVEPENRSVGFMLQDYALFPHLSVEDNILFGVKRLPQTQAKARANRIIERLSISALKNKFPHMLSGGEQQRVALARALTPEPSILLMDEPFSNLDRRLADTIRHETLAILRELKTTAIIVTHDPEEALSSSDRIALMRGGKILQVGTSYELYYHPNSRYTADYFCAYNKLPGVIKGSQMMTEYGAFPASFAAAENTKVTVYLRPQSISVSRDGGGLPGRIVSRRFRGDAEELTVAIDGINQNLIAHIPNLLPCDGDRVEIVIPSIGVLAFQD
jgi:iron(III) transport system ATP-binding protein